MAGPVGTYGPRLSISQVLVRLRETGTLTAVPKPASRRRSLTPAFVIGAAVFGAGHAYAEEVPVKPDDTAAGDKQSSPGAVRPAGDKFGLKHTYKFEVETQPAQTGKLAAPEGTAPIDAVMLPTLPTLDTLTSTPATVVVEEPVNVDVEELTDRREELIASAEANRAKMAFLTSTTGAGRERAYTRPKPGYAEPEDYIRVQVIHTPDEEATGSRRPNRPNRLKLPELLLAETGVPTVETALVAPVAPAIVAPLAPVPVTASIVLAEAMPPLAITPSNEIPRAVVSTRPMSDEPPVVFAKAAFTPVEAAKAIHLTPAIERIANRVSAAPVSLAAAAMLAPSLDRASMRPAPRLIQDHAPGDPIPTLGLKTAKRIVSVDEAVVFAPEWTEGHMVERAEILIHKASSASNAAPVAVIDATSACDAEWRPPEADAYVFRLRIHAGDGRYQDTPEQPLFVLGVPGGRGAAEAVSLARPNKG